jgi:FkbM family methyltransferase
MTIDTSVSAAALPPAATPSARRLGAVLARARDVVTWRLVMPLRHPRRRVRVGEFQVEVHRVGEWIARQLITTGGYEQREIAAMCALVRPGDTVLDVGANIGLHTLHLSRAVGPTGTVHAFEPDPANAALLRRNVERNRCPNVVVHPYGLGPEAAQHRLYACKGNKGFQSLASSEWSTSEVVVDIKRAGDVLVGVEAQLMKLDVEGAEPFVLAGFATWPSTIVFEFVPAQLRAMQEDPTGFLQAFLDRGYALRPIGGAEAPDLVDDALAFTTLADRTGDDYNVVARLPSVA